MKRTKFATTKERASFITYEKYLRASSTATASALCLYLFLLLSCSLYFYFFCYRNYPNLSRLFTFQQSSISNIGLNMFTTSTNFHTPVQTIRSFYLFHVNTSLENSAKQHTSSLKLCCDFRKCSIRIE